MARQGPLAVAGLHSRRYRSLEGKPLSRFIERMFLQHKEIFLMKNGTHYSLQDTDWLISSISYSVCFQLVSISTELCSHFLGLRPMCFMKKGLFSHFNWKYNSAFWNSDYLFHYYLPKINGETPPIGPWQTVLPFLRVTPLRSCLASFSPEHVLSYDPLPLLKF